MISRTILLVDDDSDLLEVVGRRCQSNGLNVQYARNLLTATTVIERHVPDVICIDVEMPTGNGLQFCRSLVADPRTARVPIIVLTGHTDEATVRACGDIGAHYLLKSADVWATLGPVVRHVLAESPARRRQTAAADDPRLHPTHSIPPLPAAAGLEPAPAGGRGDHSTTRCVVVADDDTELVDSLVRRFRALGCSAIGVHSTLDAVNAIHRELPDLVVLDVKMPTGSGLGVCELMATDARLRSIPVIVLTGCTDEQTIRRCHDMLVFYVEKGADVWQRIDPLVRELLHLEPAPSAPPPTVDPATAKRAPTLAVEKVPAATARSDPDESLVDAVFAMLGADDSQSSQSQPFDAEVPSGWSDRPWILSIDDDADFTEALKRRFGGFGVGLVRAANGMEGFRQAFATPASAILLDHQMPNGQGDYILGRLKGNPVTRDIPVYMVTGVRDKTLERRVLAIGAAGFFLKPIDFEQLRRQLATHIDALNLRSTARQTTCLPA